MISIATAINTGLTAGGAGSSTANATGTERLTGRLVGFQVTYGGSPPAVTTDVTVQAVSGPLGTRTLLTIANAATDGVFLVLHAVVDAANAAVTGANVQPPLFHDLIKVTIAQANDNDYAIVTPIIEVDG